MRDTMIQVNERVLEGIRRDVLSLENILAGVTIDGKDPQVYIDHVKEEINLLLGITKT